MTAAAPLRIVFAGTPDFGARQLEALLAAEGHGIEVVGVLSQPARPRGRGLAVAPSPVMERALGLGLPLASPARWDDDTSSWLKERRADLLVTAAYGLILPAEALTLSRLGAINVHASLLPRWRGAAPVQRAIEAGDARTGITIFIIEPALDSGPILAMAPLAIEENETAPSLLARLAAIAGPFLVETIVAYASGRIVPRPQSAEGMTRAPRLRKEEGILHWSDPAGTILKRCRAFDPWPGVTIGGLKLLALASAEGRGEPGEILSSRPLVVACGTGALRLDRLQPAGKKPMGGADYVNGRRLAVGEILE
jgi:methionyl-tRNA formyltransferase